MASPLHLSVVSKLTKAGLTVQSHYVRCDWGGYTNYWADTATDRISWSVNDGQDRPNNALYVRPLNQQDDITTDYFAGTFVDIIGQALRLARA